MIVWKRNKVIVGIGDGEAKIATMAAAGARPAQVTPSEGEAIGQALVYVLDGEVINVGIWETGDLPAGAGEETRDLRYVGGGIEVVSDSKL